MLLFTAHDIAHNFDARDNAKGRAYQQEGRVIELRASDEGGMRLSARVQGSQRQPYRVEIALRKKRAGIEIVGECSCPVGYMCKHAAAALYEAIAQENRAVERLARGRSKKSVSSLLSEETRRWLSDIGQLAQKQDRTESAERIVYLLADGLSAADAAPSPLAVAPALQSKNRDGSWGKPRLQSLHQLHAMTSYGGRIGEADRTILTMADLNGAARNGLFWTMPDDPELVDLFMRRLLATGRFCADEQACLALTEGPEISAAPAWEPLEDGAQKPFLSLPRAGLRLLTAASPWYVDLLTGASGPVRFETNAALVSRFLALSRVGEKEVETVRSFLASAAPVLPAPFMIAHGKESAPAPRAHLALCIVPQPDGTRQKTAFLTFLYGDRSVHPLALSSIVPVRKKDALFLCARPRAFEEKLKGDLRAIGLSPHPLADPAYAKHLDPRGLALIEEQDASPWFWCDFLEEAAPRLRAKGIEIDVADGFETAIIRPDDDDIDASFTQTGEWWFSLDLGILIEGKRTPLLPLLVAMLRSLRSLSDVDRLARTATCYAPLPDGRKVALPAARVKTILKTLVELFEEKTVNREGKMRVSMDLAAAFVGLEGIVRPRWLGEGKLHALVQKLGAFDGIKKQPVPAALRATLRPYQAEGVDWLHFLGAYGLSGVLADDMGLGKTVQALAYICGLKERGALKGPCLIVMPTSLIANWQTETARFAPSLRAVTLHGAVRAARFKDVAKADIVFTTYPLLPRDAERLNKTGWALVVLDEAQAIKNPSAKMTRAACALQARQRLCLTGTPVENHLGEAWSLFAFLMPGLLGEHARFARTYRTPIERDGDVERKALLARRVRPFVLRRLKSEVERDLPPKTEIVRRVTLAESQRDLYETVRAAMDARVREEIEAKGVAKSQIVILDALLKLRQTCCDPRLVKLAGARRVRESAKLEALMEMLPTLIEDGRHILLFSQFTSMLDLIGPEIEKAGIPFVELRGTTKDRKTPVARFQKGEVPLFLISLKAGGTGLNLTAADAVIHYDPWWNPAVENQATDRAHRIGQDKPVFVYKLIAENTVEERILELQGKKAGLAAALFGDSPDAAARLTAEDLKALLE